MHVENPSSIKNFLNTTYGSQAARAGLPRQMELVVLLLTADAPPFLEKPLVPRASIRRQRFNTTKQARS